MLCWMLCYRDCRWKFLLLALPDVASHVVLDVASHVASHVVLDVVLDVVPLVNLTLNSTISFLHVDK